LIDDDLRERERERERERGVWRATGRPRAACRSLLER